MRLFHSLTGAALLCLALAPSAVARDALYAVASRGASAVTVGENGRILYATQGPHNQAWYPASSVLTDHLFGVTTSGAAYVAVGAGGRVVRSIDPEGNGTRWIPESSRTQRNLFAIAHPGDRLVAVGDSAAIVYKQSQSQGQWLPANHTNIPTRRSLRGVAGNLSFAVAVGDRGTVIWSNAGDLATWYATTGIPTDRDLLGVALGPGAATGRFWAVGMDGTILRSLPNPSLVWEQIESPAATHLRAVAFSPGGIGVAVGDAGTILFSNGGATWTQVSSSVTVDLFGVHYTGSGAGGGFIVVGDRNAILWSALGTEWLEVTVSVEEESWGSIRASWRGGAPEDRGSPPPADTTP